MTENRLTTLEDAVRRHVPDGSSVLMGACLESLIPFAFGHEFIRQGRRDLTLIGPISDILFDQLIGAGCVERVIAAWIGNVSAGLAHCYRRAVEQGIPRRVEVREHSNLSLGLALLAAGVGSPFTSTRTTLGTDLPDTNPDLTVADNPLDPGDPVVLIRALHPDVAVFHVQKADAEGHAHVWGNMGIAREGALAARKIILTAEELAPVEELTADPNRILIPAHKVAAVVECPGGADPSPVPGYTDRDHEAFNAYHRATRTPEGFAEWLEETVGAVGATAQGAAPAAAQSGGRGGPAGGSAGTAGYTGPELMVAAAAREIRDGDVVSVGMRLPMLAFVVAKRLHAPRAVAYFECGIVRETIPDEMLYTLADPPAFRGAGWATQTTYLLGQVGAGWVDVGFVGGAQMDRFGNLNTSVIGPFEQPEVRLPGGGGAADFACLARRMVLIMPHQRRRFVEKVDFVTSPGFGDGDGWRERVGLPRGGPAAVVTTLGVLRFDEHGEAYLASYHPFSSVDEVRDATGWELRVADDVCETPPPTKEELAAMREYDPEGFWTGAE